VGSKSGFLKDEIDFRTGEFVNRYTELRFRQYGLKRDIYPMKNAMLVIAVAALAFIYADYKWQHDTPWWPVVVYIRLFVAFLSLIIYVLLQRITRFVDFDRLVLVWLVSVSITLLLTDIMRPVGHPFNLLFDVMALLGFYTYFVFRLIWQVLVAFVFSIALTTVLLVTKAEYDAAMDSIVGVLVLGNALGFFVAMRMHFFRRLSYFHKCRLQQTNLTMKRMAYRDGLTDLWNRRAFDEQVEQLVNRHHRYQQKFSLVVIDLDFFKDVNDTYGHETGDYLLVEFAKRVSKSLRPSDTVYRYGGEEFVMTLASSGVDGAEDVVNRIQKNMNLEPLLIQYPELKVTASFGIAEVKEGDRNIRSVFRRADEALYQAKHEGRNTYRIV